MMTITHLREYQTLQTVGKLFISGDAWGSTLEDIGRPAGVKIPKETCIPEGLYHVAITQSQRFGRPMILLYTDQATKTCKLEGIEFTGIRVHKGTKTEHTEGCVLYQGDLEALEKKVAESLNRGEIVMWSIERAKHE